MSFLYYIWLKNLVCVKLDLNTAPTQLIWSKGIHRTQFLLIWQKKFRSSRSQMFFKITVVEKFSSFTEKHLCWILWQRCFPVKFAKILRTSFFTEHLGWLFREIYELNSCYNLLNSGCKHNVHSGVDQDKSKIEREAVKAIKKETKMMMAVTSVRASALIIT